MLGRIWAIALNTFREAARIRVLYGIVVLVVGANLLAVVLGQMSIHEEERVARDIGLAGISLFGSLTAIFLGVFLLYTEVQRRTIHAIVSKPIERWEFVVGKYLGMVLVLTILVALFGFAMVLVLAWQGGGVTAAIEGLVAGAGRVRRVGDELALTLAADADVDAWLDRAHALGAKVVYVEPRHETLEDLFVRQVEGAHAG